MTKSEFKREIKGCNNGDVIFINALSLSDSEIDQLSEYIKIGVLYPVRKEVEKIVNPLQIEKVMSGEVIVPIMMYTVMKGGD